MTPVSGLSPGPGDDGTERAASSPAGPPIAPLIDVPDLSPEARRRAALRLPPDAQGFVAPVPPARHARALEVIRRVWTGVYHDGFIHAGNFAYMVLIALFPFFITGAAIFSALGEASQRAAAINTVLIAMPPVVAEALDPVARSVVEMRTGWLLWVGGLIGLWTVGSLVETIRDILRRAYGTRWEHAFWRYRLASTGLIVASVILILLSIAAQVAIGAAQQAIEAWMPQFSGWIASLSLSRFVPAVIFFLALWLLFISLTPGAYRGRRYPKWPGALLVSLWWLAVTGALPGVLRHFFTYNLTYGSLAGVMIALFFFWLVGLGMVVGAELNAALAETPEERDVVGQADDRARRARRMGIEQEGA